MKASIKANIDTDVVEGILENEYNIRVANVKRLDGYDDVNFHLLPDVDQNISFDADGYVLKIINSRDSMSTDFIEQYVQVLLHLRKQKYPCPTPVPNKFNKYYKYWYDDQGHNIEGSETKKHLMILLTYIPGEILHGNTCDANTSCSLGHFISDLHSALPKIEENRALKRAGFPWSLESVPGVINLMDSCELSEDRRQLVINVINDFQTNVLSKLSQFEQGIIHNDTSFRNLLVKKIEDGNSYKFVGLIDFSDMMYTAYLFEIAITSCYLSLDNPSNWKNLISSFLAGYDRRSLTCMEIENLKLCICARLCQSLILGLHAFSVQPNNANYVLDTQRQGWNLLTMFYELSNEQFVNNITGQDCSS